MTPSTNGDNRTGTEGGGQQSAQGQDRQSAQGGGQQPNQQSDGTQATGLLANAAIRFGLVLVGFVLFLFALGQAVGFGLLDLFIEAVTSQTGRWLVVALFGLVLIALAQRGIQNTLLDN